jgi:hypothetical protein
MVKPQGENGETPGENLALLFHQLLSRDREDGRATGQPQGVGPEAYLNGTLQGPTPEDARKDGHIRGRSRLFIKQPGWRSDYG